ncbi:SDR family oxidoreductase [Cellulosimicrobium funkei]|nr:SDR family oxidoreductase [Cellulosimicrobium funkei]
MDTGLRGKNVVIPGASSGIGRAIAKTMADEGANVVLAARRGDVLREVAYSLPSAAVVEIDLNNEGSAGKLVQEAEAAFGPIDVLILNGGGPPTGGAADIEDVKLLAALQSLLVQQQRLTAAVLPGMRQRGWGRIVAVGSSGIQAPLENLALSNIGRAGLAGYLKSLATEVAQDGVTVNMVLPGRIATERVASLDSAKAEKSGRTDDEVRRDSMSSIPARRYGQPEEFAAVVTFLASEAAAYVTGEQVRCDGGLVRSY